MRRLLGGLVIGALVVTGCGSSDPSTTGSTSPEQAQLAAATSVRVVAAGDIACPASWPTTRKQCRQAATARVARALNPAQVIALGDLQYQKGRYRAFKRSYHKSWGKLRSITWPIPGNHEYETTGARGYFRYFRFRQPGPPGWYRRSLNGWELYFLNSNCNKVDCASQRAWLDSEMASHPSTCSLVAFHHPRYSSGEHGGKRGMRRFWAIADKYGADLALSGHDHDYERFAPMDALGQADPNGIRQFVSGGGGKNLYPKATSAPGSEVFRKRFGVLELNLTPTGYSWRFVSPNLRVRDSGSALCRT